MNGAVHTTTVQVCVCGVQQCMAAPAFTEMIDLNEAPLPSSGGGGSGGMKSEMNSLPLVILCKKACYAVRRPCWPVAVARLSGCTKKEHTSEEKGHVSFLYFAHLLHASQDDMIILELNYVLFRNSLPGWVSNECDSIFSIL